MSRPAHQWDISGVKHMKIEEESAIPLASSLPPIVDPNETERYVESLKKFDISEVGSSAWMDQHRRLEKLNLQAHQNAMTNSDEFVLEAFLTFSKMEFLVYDLLLIEAWKEHVFPLLLDELAGRNNMRLYFILYHEATLINLIEVFMYYKHAVEAGGEKMLELVDYLGRKLVLLNGSIEKFRDHDLPGEDSTGRPAQPVSAELAAQYASALAARSPKEELLTQLQDIEFRVCISAVSVSRFLTEHAEVLPLSVVSRIVDTHDFLVLLVPLIENPPWTRRVPSTGKWQKVVDHKWTDVAAIDLLKITKLEGQPWLAVYFLLAKDVFRERYHLNSFRKGQLLRVRKYLNDLMLDQLPFLADIQRYMDELAVTEVPEPTSFGNSVFLFQQVAVLRESIVQGKVWPDVASQQKSSVFTMTDRDDKDLLQIAEMYSDDLVGDVIEHNNRAVDN